MLDRNNWYKINNLRTVKVKATNIYQTNTFESIF